MNQNDDFPRQEFALKNLIFIGFVFIAGIILLIQIYYGLVPPKVTLVEGGALTRVWDGATAPEADEFVTSVEGLKNYRIYYKEAPNPSEIGKQTLTVVVKRGIGFSFEAEVDLYLLLDDGIPPEIYVENFEVYEGDAISYMSRVTVDDHCGAANVEVSVDSSGVNVNKIGTYTATYIARDIFGNEAKKTVKVTVKERPTDTLYDEIDSVIASRGWKSLSAQKKAKALFDYLRSGSFAYIGSSNKSDEWDEAYHFLTTGEGDCFSYYALAKMFFKRLGVETRDVQRRYKVDNATHYWLLIKLEDGSWYHFDACPQRQRIDSYLMTDAQLDEYEQKRGMEYYNFNSSGLPERATTPIVDIDMSKVERS